MKTRRHPTMMFWVTLLSIASPVLDPLENVCQSTPALMRHIAPLGREYREFVRETQKHHLVTAQSQSRDSEYRKERHKHVTGHRRARSYRARRANPNPIGYSPISLMNLTGLSNVQQYWVAGNAWKLSTLLYQADSDKIDLSMTAVGGTVKTGSTTILLGSAAMSSRVITLYVDNIPSTDALLLVIMHEIDHLLGFGTLSSPGAESFYDRHNPITLVYDSLTINECVRSKQGYTGDVLLHTDANGAHWNLSSPQFDQYDLMMPIISFKDSGISVCSTHAIIESRPGWTHNLCEKDIDCQLTAGATCVSIGHHWTKVCQTPHSTRRHRGPLSPTKTVSTFATFCFIVGVYWTVTLECRRRMKKLHPNHEQLRWMEEYPWRPPPKEYNTFPLPPTQQQRPPHYLMMPT